MTRSTLQCAVLLVSVVGAHAHAQTPATRRARELMALINTATPASIQAYSDTAFSARLRGYSKQAMLDYFLGQRDRSGTIEWVDVQHTAGDSATALLRRRLTGEPFALYVLVENAAPHRVASMGQREPRAAAGAEARIASDAELASTLGRYVTALARADVFSGTVMVAKDGKAIYSGAFGPANRDFGAPNTIETKFNLGSMNKMFTSVIIARLVEQGRLSYDDPLSKFLPEFPNAAAAKTVQIKHLLTHTSGLGSYFNEEFDRSSRARFRTVDDMMQLTRGDSLAFAPGSRWSYSNTGMLVLGKVIEVVTKQDYFDYVREHLYKPAGMTSSDSYQLDEVNPNLAVGYEREYQSDGTRRFRNNIFMHVIRGGPAGGGYSTAGDLVRFASALQSGKLVSAGTYELLTTPRREVNSPAYGYGFQVDTVRGIAGHGGGFNGIDTNLDIFKGTGYVAVVLSNYGLASQPVIDKIRELVRRRTAGAQ